MLIALVSAKGSPGVTSAAMTLTALTKGLMIELDPSGGSLDCWLRSIGEPALVPTASALRRHADPHTLESFATSVVPGVRAIRAPTSGPVAESTIAAATERLVSTLAPIDTTVFLDAGRWSRAQPTARRIFGCDIAAVVCSPTVEGVETARSQLGHLVRFVDQVVVLAIGDRPYGAAEIADVVRAPVATIAWDPRGLARLLDRGVSRAWTRTGLARSARAALDVVFDNAPRAMGESAESSRPSGASRA